MAKRKSPPVDPRWTSDLRPAPGDLMIVQAFLNTADFTQQPDVAGPRRVADCFELWDLVPQGTKLGNEDLQRAIEMREALRSLLTAAQWKQPTGPAAEHLDRTVAAASVRFRFADDGRVRPEPLSNGLDGALARLCGFVASAQIQGTWELLKVCLDEKCRSAFFDRSRSHSGKWCSSRCSSRRTSLTYRHRNLERIRASDRGDAAARRMARAIRRRYG